MITFRSLCPLARSLDIFGDKWTLLILRDISIFGKSTFKELMAMPERIATNTLADRLERLTALQILTKTQSNHNKLVYHYAATEKGTELMPIIKAVLAWSDKYLYDDTERTPYLQMMEQVTANIR